LSTWRLCGGHNALYIALCIEPPRRRRCLFCRHAQRIYEDGRLRGMQDRTQDGTQDSRVVMVPRCRCWLCVPVNGCQGARLPCCPACQCCVAGLHRVVPGADLQDDTRQRRGVYQYKPVDK
jgi:hypothetical protein